MARSKPSVRDALRKLREQREELDAREARLRDEAAAESLRAYASERRLQSGEIFQRGIDRGELADDVDVGLCADVLAGFIWKRLLTGRIERDPVELRKVARQMVRGLLA